jgi:hypothetical protein
MPGHVDKPDRLGTPAGTQRNARGRRHRRGVRGGRLVLRELGSAVVDRGGRWGECSGDRKSAPWQTAPSCPHRSGQRGGPWARRRGGSSCPRGRLVSAASVPW